MGDDPLLDLVNASGFLFQLRIERELSLLHGEPASPWHVTAREHRWLDPTTDAEGFIDLVLEYGFGRIFVECKRVTDANWVFLAPEPSPLTRMARMLWQYRPGTSNVATTFHDFQAEPASIQAAFCVVRGQAEKDTPMLERVSSILLHSIEAIASLEANVGNLPPNRPAVNIPLIVTNATLRTCAFSPTDIGLDTGRLDSARFQEVPFIRFHKNFSSTKVPLAPDMSIEKLNALNQRSVFIVNSSHLVDFLRQLELPYKLNAPWPWEDLRS